MTLELDIQKTLTSHSQRFKLSIRIKSTKQRIVIMGPSGSGKSLTLKAIAGLLRPDSGYIRLHGHTLFDADAGICRTPQQRRLGYLFQDYALFPHLTVYQNIAFALFPGWRNPPQRLRPERWHPAVSHWLTLFNLQAVANHYPSQLSGGQRQRTALARALIHHPRALLLDEPFSALDGPLRRTLRTELLALQQRLAIPLILISHDGDDAQVFGQHVLHLQDGHIRTEPRSISHNSTGNNFPQTD
ncbi:MAG: ATP-binding cassette domain-containing protein [Lautropia sp.]|nr:ATP-binding cassette domain-containing protein [Lautropia sp.]